MNGDLHSDRRKCIAHVEELLSQIGIAFCGTSEAISRDSVRGGMYFLEYIPQETTFHLLPDFPRYFHSALRHNLLSPRDAAQIAHQEVLTGAVLREKYRKCNGRFLQTLLTGKIGEFFDSAANPPALRWIEGRETWFPDILHRELHIPCVIDECMNADGFRCLRLDPKELSEVAQHPLRALAAIMDVVCVGSWLGLGRDDVLSCIKLLEGHTPWTTTEVVTKPYAEVIRIPCFSQGFQGVLIGFFKNIRKEHKERLYSMLRQLGERLAHQSSINKKLNLVAEMQSKGVAIDTIAAGIIGIASPAELVMIESQDGALAFVMREEGPYLAGYDIKHGDEATQFKNNTDNETLEAHMLDPPFRVAIKTLRTYGAFDPILHGISIKADVAELLSLTSRSWRPDFHNNLSSNTEHLNLDELEKTIQALQYQLIAPRGSTMAAKLLCFFEMVRSKIRSEEMKLVNNEMRKRMSEKLPKAISNGYHVTGKALRKFEAAIGERMPNKFVFEALSQNVTHVRWRWLR